MYKTMDARKPVVGQTDYPTKMNGLIDDVKNAVNLPGLPFSFKEGTTAGLTLGLFGGEMMVNGVLTTIADTTTLLAGSNTNYVEHDAAGAVTDNTTGFSADKFPIGIAVTDAGSITSYTDRRNVNSLLMPGRVSIAVAGGVGTTVLTAAQWANDVIEFTGALTGARTITAPTAVSRPKVIRNATTGAFTLTVKTAAGTGKVITQGKRSTVYCDGTNVELAVDDAAGVGAAPTGAVTGSGLTMTTSRLLGRTTASSGAIEEISVSGALVLSGGGLTAAAATDIAAGVIEIAVQSEMEAGADTTRAVVPGRQHYHPSAAKAWVNCDNTGAVAASYGVSSVTDVATGRAQANLTTSMSSANYAAVCCTNGGGGGIFGGADALAAGSFELRSWNTSTQTLQDSGRNYGAVYGDQ